MTLAEIVRAWQGKQVTVVGDVILDHWIYGVADRISPEAPVPVVRVTREKWTLGGAGNVAENVKSMGGEPWLFCGSNKYHERHHDTLCRLTSHLDSTMCPMEAISVKHRVVVGNQVVARYDDEPPQNENDSTTAADLVYAAMVGADAVACSNYDKGFWTEANCRHISKAVADLKKPMVLDPKRETFIKGARIVKANNREAGEWNTDSWLDFLECESIIVTHGGYGMDVTEKHKATVHIPAISRPVFDVTGAGDTALAALALGSAVGAGILDCARLANIAAGIAVSHPGTARVTAEEILQECETT